MGYSEQFNELIKSIDNANRLNYFKAELLKILDAKEKNEDSLSKAIENYFKEINKSIYGISIEKGRAGTIGEIRTWKDGKKYKKMPNGKWVRVYQQQNRSAEISIARLKGKVRNAQSVDELMQIVMNNIHRFEDENGQILPIVEELKKEVASNKTSLKQKIVKKQKELNFNNIPKSAYNSHDEEMILKSVIDSINDIEPVNSKLKDIYNLFINNMNKLYPNFKLKITEAGNQVAPWDGLLEFNPDKSNDPVKSFIHEWMHMIDYKCGDKTYGTKINDNLNNLVKSSLIKDVPKKIQTAIFGDVVPDFRIEMLNNISSQLKLSLSSLQYKDARFKNITKIVYEKNNNYDDYINDLNTQNENSALCDIIDALSGGKLFDLHLVSVGHGRGNVSDPGFEVVQNRSCEILADYAALNFTKPKHVTLLKEYYPELCAELDKILNIYAKKLEEIIYG